jgi:transposase
MMTARPRRSFTLEFKAHTVELLRTSGKSVGEVCRDLDLTETAVRRWLAQADIDEGRRDGLTTDERDELSRLRRENRVLREEREILRKAAAFSPRRRPDEPRQQQVAALVGQGLTNRQVADARADLRTGHSPPADGRSNRSSAR